VLIGREEELYQEAEERTGGWRGFKDFTVTAIVERAPNIKSFTFQDPEYTGPFEFTPGQFLTLKVEPEGKDLTAPRHYTITSSPGEDVLQCTVKHLPDGKVSSYLHKQVSVGDTVQLAPPFGIFTPPAHDTSVVLISAGIGVTPMLAFFRHFRSRVALVVHVDKCAESFAFRDEFENAGVPLKTYYTQGTDQAGRPDAVCIGASILREVGTAHDFYLSGPPQFMAELQAALVQNGAERVHVEAFGPKLSVGCPMHSGAGPPVEVKIQRGSVGMGLPELISDQSIHAITQTAALLSSHATCIAGSFYQKLLGNHPELFKLFSQNAGFMGIAELAIAHVSNIHDLSALVLPGSAVDLLAHYHAMSGVLPEHYLVVHDIFLESSQDILGDTVTQSVSAALSEAVLFLAKVLIDREEELYQEAESRAQVEETPVVVPTSASKLTTSPGVPANHPPARAGATCPLGYAPLSSEQAQCESLGVFSPSRESTTSPNRNLSVSPPQDAQLWGQLVEEERNAARLQVEAKEREAQLGQQLVDRDAEVMWLREEASRLRGEVADIKGGEAEPEAIAPHQRRLSPSPENGAMLSTTVEQRNILRDPRVLFFLLLVFIGAIVSGVIARRRAI